LGNTLLGKKDGGATVALTADFGDGCLTGVFGKKTNLNNLVKLGFYYSAANANT
jgi:hypothetical protein